MLYSDFSIQISVTIVYDGIPRLFLLIDDGIVICVSDEHSSKAEFPIEVTDDGIAICVNNEHPEKAEDPIEVTEDGIVNVICVSDEHPKKA